MLAPTLTGPQYLAQGLKLVLSPGLRLFVLLPLAEIAPALVLPCGTPLAELVARCPHNDLAIIAPGADEQEPL